MSFLFAVPVIAIAGLAVMLFLTLTRPSSPLCIRRPTQEAEPEPQPGPRVPRDLDRPYPRPKGGRRRQDSTCPVCGTGDTTGALDGRVLGWRAHASCAEWLGDWKPAPPPFKPDRSLIGYIEQGQKQSVRIQVNESPGAQINVGDGNAQNVCCDGCGVPLGTGVRCHDAGGRRYCPTCDREQRRKKEGAYAAPPPKRSKARYLVIDISTVLTVDGFHEGGYQVAQPTVSYEESADLPGSPQVRVEPEYAAATLLRPEPVMYGWSVWIRAATPEEAHKTLAALEDMARTGGGLPVGEWRADLERLISAVGPLSPGLPSLPG